VLPIDPQSPDDAVVARAAEILRRGGLVAVPTETVYGLAARADDAAAVARVFEAKGRPAYNPLIVHVADTPSARALSTHWTPLAERCANAFWPGPLTLVVARERARVPDVVAGAGPTVALRAPAHPVARAVLQALGVAFAAPSANRFQSLSPTTAGHVLRSLDGRIDLVLDGGPCAHGIESTVIDATGDVAVVLRPGAVSFEHLREVLGALRVRARPEATDDAALPSPGMLDRHYAPRARVVLARGDALDEAREAHAPRVAVLTHRAQGGTHRLPSDPEGYARGLYGALHTIDEEGYEVVIIEAVSDAPGWEAVRDRLARAGA
jgi:L-threonylcarbamoyladenylate synthase